MPIFEIKHAFNLQSANSKLMLPRQLFTTEDEAQVAELRKFEKDGACEEKVSKPAEKPDETKTVDPNDDLSLVKGVGATTVKKLAEKGITTKSGLKAAMLDAAREAEMKELLGANHEKVLAQFKEPSA